MLSETLKDEEEETEQKAVAKELQHVITLAKATAALQVNQSPTKVKVHVGESTHEGEVFYFLLLVLIFETKNGT